VTSSRSSPRRDLLPFPSPKSVVSPNIAEARNFRSSRLLAKFPGREKREGKREGKRFDESSDIDRIHWIKTRERNAAGNMEKFSPGFFSFFPFALFCFLFFFFPPALPALPAPSPPLFYQQCRRVSTTFISVPDCCRKT